MGVKFVRAQCDKILELSEYRDTACPHFLFYMVCAHATVCPCGGAESVADGGALCLRASDASTSANPAHAMAPTLRRAPALVRMARRSSTSRGLRSLS
jgi:hypothetical protein